MRAWIALAGFAGALVLAQGAHTEDRYQLATATDDKLTFVDIDRIISSGGTATAWTLIVPKALDETFNPPAAYELLLYRFDCQNQVVTLLYANTYNQDGSSAQGGPVPLNAEPIIPDSQGDRAAVIACNRQYTSVDKSVEPSISHAISDARKYFQIVR